MSLFTQYTPVQSPAPSQSARGSASREERGSEREESTKGKLTEKDLFELVSKVDGLPNDTRALVSSLQNMFQMQQITGTSDVSDLASTYLSNIYQIKMASYNKKEYDKAYTEVTKNGGLNEYAITASGQVIVMDEDDNLKQISVAELLKGTSKYRPLTNSNLLYLRAYQPEYINNNQILNTVANGIGMEQVDKMIREKLSSLGTSETVRSGYSVKADSYIAQGLNVLSQVESAAVAGQTGMTLDGMYKNKIITKDQKQQAEAALQYIYNTLPDNAKTLLSIKAGNASNPQAGAQAVILQLITSRMSQTNSSETTWEGTLEQVTKSGKGKSGSGSGDDGLGSDDIKTAPYYNMSRMIGGNPTSLSINKGTNYQMDVDGINYPSIPGFDGKPIGKTSLENLLVSGLQGVVTDKNAITFGNVVLSSNDFENVMYDGTGGAMAILPTKLSNTGRKVVDLEALDRWEAANKQLRDMGIESIDDPEHQQEIVQVLYQNQLEKLVNVSSGSLDYSALGQFMIVDGYAVDHSSKNTFKDSSFVTKVDETSDEIPMIERALSTDKDQSNYKIDVDNWYDWNGHNTVYKGSIYIPITSNQLQALTASGQHVKEGPAIQKEYEYQMLQKRRQARQPKLGIL